MKLYHIVAMARNRVIGKDNQLPWHFPEDLKHFKELTTGSTVIMGRKTFESIGRPLPKRENFVLTRTPRPSREGVVFFPSLEEALRAVRTPDAYIIGGADLYRQTIEGVDGIYLSYIDEEYEGDVFYPMIPAGFQEKSRIPLRTHPAVTAIFYENVNKHAKEQEKRW